MRLFSIGLLLLFCQHTALAGYKVYRHIYNKTGETWKITDTGHCYGYGHLYVDGKKIDYAGTPSALITPGTHTLDFTSTEGLMVGCIKLYPASQSSSSFKRQYKYNRARFLVPFIWIGNTHILWNAPANGDITLSPLASNTN